MSSQSIFDRLKEASNESKRIDSLKTEMSELEQKLNDVLLSLSELNTKTNQTNDLMASRIRNEDFYELKSAVADLRIKTTAHYDELKKVSPTFDVKKVIDDLDDVFTTKEEFKRELDEIKLCLEHYVKNTPSILVNKDYEKRLTKLEEKNIKPVTVKTFR